MKQIKTKRSNFLVEMFDAMFIMLLCFGTLLSAMLLKGDSIAGLKYHLNYITFGAMFLCLLIYISLLIIHSEKGLKGMIKILYVEHK